MFHFHVPKSRSSAAVTFPNTSYIIVDILMSMWFQLHVHQLTPIFPSGDETML